MNMIRRVTACMGLATACFVAPALAAPDTWDSRLSNLGVCYFEAQVASGTWYWKLISGVYEDESQSGGNHHIYYKCLNASGQPIENQKCWAAWPSINDPGPCPIPNPSPDGQVDIYTKGSLDNYWGNFGMAGGWCPFYPEGSHGPYACWVDSPSDQVWGMGMPCNRHVNYRYIWQWTQAGGQPDPEMSRSPVSFTRTVIQGNNPSSNTFEVWNSGGGTLNYSIADNQTWLSENPTSGNSTGEHDTITINYSTSGLSPGTYNATISITGNAPNSPQTIPVSVTVQESGGGEPRWHLAYWRRIGYYVNSSNHSVYIWTFNRLGQPVANQPILDQNNNQRTITAPVGDPKVGYAELPVYPTEILRLKVGGALPSDLSPPMDTTLPDYGHNSWEVGFLLIDDDTDFSFDQTVVGDPANGSHAPHTASFSYYDTDPLNYSSDSKALAGGALTHGQTFVATANRVVCAKVQATIGSGQHLQWRGRIRQGGPGGQQIGATVTTRDIVSDEFWPVMLIWPLEGVDAVVLTPGNTYYFEVERADVSGEMNVYRMDNNNYPNGQLYIGGNPQPSRDIMGWVACGTLGAGPPPDPQISRLPTSFTRTVTLGENLPDDTFEVWNSGGQTLNYSITDNVGWLEVEPGGGSSTGEHDTFTINYGTTGLTLGQHNATIEITGNATNSPQTIPVFVTVEPVSYKGDSDSDGDVDLEDFGHFQVCLTGQGDPQEDQQCAWAKFDADADVDMGDLDLFLECMSGPGVTPPTACEE